MATSSVGNAAIAVLVLCALVNSAAAAQYIVGEKVGGWIELPPSSTAFDDQFKNITLKVGDTLLFPFSVGVHNVYEVSRADVSSCSGANPIAVYTQTNATVRLNTTGYHGYICEIPGHCTSGAMHLAVNVAAAAAAPSPANASSPTPTPAPTPAPRRAPTPTPAPSSVAPPPPEEPSTAPAEGPGSEGPGGSGAISLHSGSVIMVAAIVAGCAILAL